MSTILEDLKSLSVEKRRAVELPGVDRPVYVRRVTVAEMDEFLGLEEAGRPLRNLCVTVAFALVDHDGNRPFDHADTEHLDLLLSSLGPNVVRRVAEAFCDLNGIDSGGEDPSGNSSETDRG